MTDDVYYNKNYNGNLITTAVSLFYCEIIIDDGKATAD